MIASLLSVLSLLFVPPLVAVQDPKQKPTEQTVKSTCDALEKAFAKDAKAEDTGKVLLSAMQVVDPRVIALIASEGLEHSDLKIRGFAVEALARMDHPDALAALHAYLEKNDKELRGSPPRYAALLKAIARHGKESSIPALVQDIFEVHDSSVVMARILGLGHIRSTKSIEELMRLMRVTQPARISEHMPEFRLALVVLTGVDKGTDPQLWLNWYGDHKTKLEIPNDLTQLPRDMRLRWFVYWAETDPAEASAEKGKGKDAKDKEGKDKEGKEKDG